MRSNVRPFRKPVPRSLCETCSWSETCEIAGVMRDANNAIVTLWGVPGEPLDVVAGILVCEEYERRIDRHETKGGDDHAGGPEA